MLPPDKFNGIDLGAIAGCCHLTNLMSSISEPLQGAATWRNWCNRSRSHSRVLPAGEFERIEPCILGHSVGACITDPICSNWSTGKRPGNFDRCHEYQVRLQRMKRRWYSFVKRRKWTHVCRTVGTRYSFTPHVVRPLRVCSVSLLTTALTCLP